MRNLWLAGIALSLTACGAMEDMDDAEAQVAAFHRAYDAGKYGPLWDRSGPTMKEITTRQQFLDLMVAVRAKLGAVKSTSRTGFNVNYATGGSQVTLTYQTVFANGEGTETFFYDTEKPPRLLGWNVVSPALFEAQPGAVAADKVDSGGEESGL